MHNLGKLIYQIRKKSEREDKLIQNLHVFDDISRKISECKF